MMRRVLVIHTGGVGDFLLALPAIQSLASDYAITLAGMPERLSLAVEAGIAQRACSLDALDFHSVFSTPSACFASFVGQFERAVVWMRDEEGAIRRALEQAGVREVSCFPGLPPEDWPGHAADYYARCLGLVEAPLLHLKPKEPDVEVPPAEVWFHPGSGSPKKNWPREHFFAVADVCRAGGLAVGWILGPAEEDFLTPVGDVVCAQHSLPVIAAALARARLCVGNDSGIAHLAAAVRCPTVAIFGPTDADRWAPRGPWVRALRGAPWPTKAEVIVAVRELLYDPPQVTRQT